MRTESDSNGRLDSSSDLIREARSVDYQSAQIPVIIVGGGTVLDANELALRLFHASKAHPLIGLSWRDIIDPSQHLVAERRETEVRSEGRPTDVIQYKVRLCDGVPAHLMVHSTPIDFEGKAALLTTIIDVSHLYKLIESGSIRVAQLETELARSSAEIQRSAEKLQRQLERLRALEREFFDVERLHRKMFESLPDGIAVTKDFFITEINPSMSAMLGFNSTGEAIGTDIRNRLPAQAIDGILACAGEPIEIITNSIYNTPVALEMRTVAQFVDEFTYRVTMCRDVTMRRQIEQIRSELEQRFSAVVELSPNGVMLVGENVLYANQALANILGYDSPADLVGRSPLEFTHQADHDVVIDRLNDFESTNWSEPVDRTYVRSDGKEIRVELAGNIVEFGSQRRLLVIVRDVTEERLNTERLAEKEALLRAYLWAGDIGAWQWNPADDLATFSPETFRILDLPVTESGVIADYMERIHPDEKASAIRRFRDFVIDPNSDYHDEYRLKANDGAYLWVLLRGRRMTQGDPASPVVGTFTNVTTRKLGELELETVRERLSLALESGKQGVWDWDIERNHATFSKEWMEMIGESEATLQLQTIDDWRHMVHPDDWDAMWQKQTDHMTGLTATYAAEFRMRHRDQGRWVWVLSRGRVVKRGPKGEPLRILGTHTDISDRKAIEERVARLNEELTDWTVQLQATNAELEAFSYSVSHDLRGPLRGIDGFAAALAEDYGGRLDDEGREFIDRIRASAKRMSVLIDDLLIMSRITRQSMQLTSVDLTEIVLGIAAEYKHRLAQRQFEFTIQPQVTARADASLVRIVLENLLANAVKFTSGRATAVIEFGARPHDGRIEYFVRDNGVGFDEAQQSKLFHPFVRLHTEREFEGHGIGLATVRRAITKHGGSVWARSVPEGGAEFSFTLGGAIMDRSNLA